jgi:hypothetical protein
LAAAVVVVDATDHTRARWVVLILGVGSSIAHAQPETEVASDVLIYSDNDNVLVVSPQVGASHELDSEGGAVSARVVVDAITAASADVVSSATYRFSEVRTEVDLGISKSFDRWLPSAAYRYSREPDYVSHGIMLGGARRFGGDTTIWAKSSTTVDAVGRVDTPSSVFSERLLSQEIELAWTQNLDRVTLLRAVYSLSAQFGYMEKPYRSVPLFDAAGMTAADSMGGLDADNYDQFALAARPLEEVPDTRYRHAIGLRGLRYLSFLHSAARVDYRFYLDSWGLQAHTGEVAWYAQLAEHWRLNVWSRFHWQSSAAFWERAYLVDDPDTIPALRSSDRSLSRSWHSTAGLRGEYDRETFAAYVEVSAMYSRFAEFLFLDNRTALIGQVGVRWRF